MTGVRVVLADDHPMMRAGLRALLNEIPDIEVVAEASDGREALRAIERCRPRLVLLDISMPGLNGLEAITQALTLQPGLRIIVVSMHTSSEYVRQAIVAGAAGYLPKAAALTELMQAVTCVLRGETYLSPAVAGHVAASLRAGPGEATPLDRLTARHREVLQLVAEGKTTKEIARILGIGVRTVETHRAELMSRLDIHDVAGLVRFAVQHGLISSAS
jgi:DNA-binding NarL/FixJ family response regulator